MAIISVYFGVQGVTENVDGLFPVVLNDLEFYYSLQFSPLQLALENEKNISFFYKEIGFKINHLFSCECG